MKERGDRQSPDLCAGREHCRPRKWLARLVDRRANRAARLNMIENENTEDPVREKPTTGHELNFRDQDHVPADLGKAELWAGRLLSEYWDGKSEQYRSKDGDGGLFCAYSGRTCGCHFKN